MKLKRILDWIDGLLECGKFDDVSNNGLQIARHGEEVDKVAFARDLESVIGNVVELPAFEESVDPTEYFSEFHCFFPLFFTSPPDVPVPKPGTKPFQRQPS